MPNHFHWLVHVPANANLGQISKGLQVTLSSYSRAVNIQEGRVGSLFEQNTHSRLLDSTDYATTCFHYIHQNPVRRKLVERMEDWELSSFRDYIGLRTGTLVNKQLAIEWLDIPIATEDFYTEAYGVLDEEILRGLGMA
jgi:hypothetical protein